MPVNVPSIALTGALLKRELYIVAGLWLRGIKVRPSWRTLRFKGIDLGAGEVLHDSHTSRWQWSQL